MLRQGADTIRAQLDGFKLRVLRAEVPVQRHLYITEWCQIEVAGGMSAEVLVINDDEDVHVLTVSENGYGKKTHLDDFPIHNRGGQGVISIKTSDRNGQMVAATLVEE